MVNDVRFLMTYLCILVGLGVGIRTVIVTIVLAFLKSQKSI